MEAHAFLNNGIPVIGICDVGRQEIAVAAFEATGKQIEETTIMKPEELISRVKHLTIFCGEGLVVMEDRIRNELGELGIVIPFSPSTRLWSLATSAERMIDEKGSNDIRTLQPYYLRMPSIGTPKRRDVISQRGK